MRRFTPEEDQFLRDNYLTMPGNALSRALGRAKNVANQRLNVLGLIVPTELKQKWMRDSQLKPGNIPMTKGRKRSEWCSPEAIAKMKLTQFRKGDLPHNTRADGEISIRPNKQGIKYKFIRVGLKAWVPLLRYNWEQLNGPIPKGFNLIHKDGDTMNCSVENAELLSNAELMKRNSYHNYGPEIAKVIQLQGALTRKINKHKKKLNNNEK